MAAVKLTAAGVTIELVDDQATADHLRDLAANLWDHIAATAEPEQPAAGSDLIGDRRWTPDHRNRTGRHRVGFGPVHA